MLQQHPQLKRRLPNAITVARLILAAVFFAMLLFYRRGGEGMSWWIVTAGVVYGLAAISDWLDGYLARKWGVTSTFGRIVDPFVDKILILGSFVVFASHPFLVPGPDGELVSLTGVGPVVVILLLGRELLVTTIRGLYEQQGLAFGAKASGKLKMAFQSAAIPLVLLYILALDFVDRGSTTELALRILRDLAVWGTVVVTLWSVLEYIPWKSQPAAGDGKT